jgi:hypothetical protein
MSRQLNPVHFVGRRRRQTVGAELYRCPDGSVVTGGSWNCPVPPPITGHTPSWPSTPPVSTTPVTPTWGPTPPAIPTTPVYIPEIVPTIPTYVPDPVIPVTTTPSIPYTPPSIPYNPGTPPGCRPVCNPCPENQKRYYMPFVPQAGYTASVAAGALVIFVGRPQKLFGPDRLIIGSTIGAYFDIVSLTIGNIPQSLSAGNVGAEMFSEVATYVMMTFDQAYPGIDIILTAQNKSSVTQTFPAQLVGEAVG